MLAQPHPMLAGIADLRTQMATVAELDPAFLTRPERAQAMLELARLEASVHAQRLRVMAVSGDVADHDAARDVAAWLTRHTHGDPGTARADLRLAHALDHRWPAVGAALLAGTITPDQAHALVKALDPLPDDLTDHGEDETQEVLRRAEQVLLAEAADKTPRELAILGAAILDLVAPQIAEDAEARRLDAAERRAEHHTRLTLHRHGDGTTALRAVLPDHTADRLATYLEAFAAPRHTSHAAQADAEADPDATPEPGTEPGSEPSAESTARGGLLPYPRRLGQAFCALLEHLDPARLPHHGGDATTILVTIPLADLQTDSRDSGGSGSRGSRGTGGLVETGTPITAGQARRLACTATIIPAVLGGDSEILDLGRARRLYTRAQRKALRLRDRHCRAQGCTIPATWCEAHHLHPWSTGGRTDLDHGLLLCSHHHHRAHDPRFSTERLPNGDLRYTRRT